jgi:hypothetical protein
MHRVDTTISEDDRRISASGPRSFGGRLGHLRTGGSLVAGRRRRQRRETRRDRACDMGELEALLARRTGVRAPGIPRVRAERGSGNPCSCAQPVPDLVHQAGLLSPQQQEGKDKRKEATAHAGSA